jgi:hypothetical protein
MTRNYTALICAACTTVLHRAHHVLRRVSSACRPRRQPLFFAASYLNLLSAAVFAAQVPIRAMVPKGPVATDITTVTFGTVSCSSHAHSCIVAPPRVRASVLASCDVNKYQQVTPRANSITIMCRLLVNSPRFCLLTATLSTVTTSSQAPQAIA